MLNNRVFGMSELEEYAGVVHVYRSRTQAPYSYYNRLCPHCLDKNEAKNVLNQPLDGFICKIVFWPNLNGAVDGVDFNVGYTYDEKSISQYFPHFKNGSYLLVMASLAPETCQRNPGLWLFENYNHAVESAMQTIPYWQAPYPYCIMIAEEGGPKKNIYFGVFHRPKHGWSDAKEQQRIKEMFGDTRV